LIEGRSARRAGSAERRAAQLILAAARRGHAAAI
jgi:hypothetical protein